MTNEVAHAQARILVIDDEPQIRRFLDISLRALGYDVQLAGNGREGLESMVRHAADLVLLDIGLPDIDGHEVLRTLRGWTRVPIIMLTVRSSEVEKVAAFDAGANDYVTKPFGTQELMARIRSLLRQHGDTGAEPAVFDDGHLAIDMRAREIRLQGDAVTLTRKEYALLTLLLRHRNQVVTQPQILRELWGAAHVDDTHYVRILVAKLRQKLHENPAAPRYLVTEPGVGLRFVTRE